MTFSHASRTPCRVVCPGLSITAASNAMPVGAPKSVDATRTNGITRLCLTSTVITACDVPRLRVPGGVCPESPGCRSGLELFRGVPSISVLCHCPGPIEPVISCFRLTGPRACTVFGCTQGGSTVAANCPLHRHRGTRFYESLGFSIRPFPGRTHSHGPYPSVSTTHKRNAGPIRVYL